MTGTVAIREPTRADVRPPAAPLAQVCHDLPAAGWPVPEDTGRQPVLTDVVAIRIAHALGNGLVRVAGETVAAPVWLPAGPYTPPPRDYHRQLTQAAGVRAHNSRALHAVRADQHPIGPHTHPSMPAVHAEHQRCGLGGAQLAHTHAERDNDTVPAYTPATADRPRNPHPLHGHHHLGNITPPDGATLPAMRRHPHPTNTPRDR